MKKLLIYGLGNRFNIIINDKYAFQKIKKNYKIIGVCDKKECNVSEFVYISCQQIAIYKPDIILITSEKYYDEISFELKKYIDNTVEMVSFKNLMSMILCKEMHIELFENKIGAEIGGPSDIFENTIYKYCNTCDGINYSNETLWWKKENDEYRCKSRNLGKIHISDVTCMNSIEDETYDFVISSNNLEHIANPLLALSEMKRILIPNGIILIVVPKKEIGFDHNRQYTRFEHIIKDYDDSIGEDDLSHLEEIIELHDYELDPLCGGKEKFIERSKMNYINRCLHHHVFSHSVLKKMFGYLEIEVIDQNDEWSNIFIIGKK